MDRIGIKSLVPHVSEEIKNLNLTSESDRIQKFEELKIYLSTKLDDLDFELYGSTLTGTWRPHSGMFSVAISDWSIWVGVRVRFIKLAKYFEIEKFSKFYTTIFSTEIVNLENFWRHKCSSLFCFKETEPSSERFI